MLGAGGQEAETGEGGHELGEFGVRGGDRVLAQIRVGLGEADEGLHLEIPEIMGDGDAAGPFVQGYRLARPTEAALDAAQGIRARGLPPHIPDLVEDLDGLAREGHGVVGAAEVQADLRQVRKDVRGVAPIPDLP
jgi:hypothetical protein